MSKLFVFLSVFLCVSCASTNKVLTDNKRYQEDSKARYIESCLQDYKGENERCTCEANVKLNSIVVTKKGSQYETSLIGTKEAYSEKLKNCSTAALRLNTKQVQEVQPVTSQKSNSTKAVKNNKFYSCISPKEYSEKLLNERGCKVYNKSEVTEPVKAVVAMQPKYPDFAAENQITGHLKAELIVNEIGGVVNVKIIESVPEGIFDAEGIKVFKKWKFKPAKLNESKVMQKTIITYEFKI